MSEISKLNGYYIKDKKAIRYYDTVSDMKSDTTLKEGMHVKTKGYYLLNDGGCAEYLIRENSNQELDNGGSIQILDNDLVAEMIVKDSINVLSWGVKKEDNTTQTNLNKLIEYYSDGNVSIYFPTGKYYLTETIYLPQRTKIYGDGGSTQILWYGLTSDYIFNIKRGIKFCSISDLYIDGRYLACGIYDCDLSGTGTRGIRTRIYNITMENVIVGIRLDGMGSEVHNVLMNGSGNEGSYSNTDSIGLYINGTDNFINSVRIQLFYYGGLIIGANNRLVTVKFCVNKIGAELRPGESGMYMIDLQENYQDNLIMKETIESTLILNNQTAGFSDQYLNGNSLQYSLLKMIKCNSINVIGTLGCRTKLGNGSCGNEKYAIYIDELSSNINANFSYIYPITSETAQLDKPIFYCFETSSNKIVVNNKLLEGTSTFDDNITVDSWSLTTMSYFNLNDNVIRATYKDSLDFSQEQLVLNFLLDDQNDPKVIEIDCEKIIFSKVWINVAAPSHNSYAKHINYGFDFTKFVNFEGGSKLKFSYIGNTALLSEYGSAIEELIGYPVERISFQVFGYITERTDVDSVIKVADYE